MSEEKYDLKPCPFCGSDKIYVSRNCNDNTFYVWCFDCLARVSNKKTDLEAVDSWNNARVYGRIAELGEELENTRASFEAARFFNENWRADYFHWKKQIDWLALKIDRLTGGDYGPAFWKAVAAALADELTIMEKDAEQADGEMAAEENKKHGE